MIRYGFISNSSSTSFVIPIKYLTKEEVDIYRDYTDNYSQYNEELRMTNNYIYGRMAHCNPLNNMIKKYSDKEGVDYYES